MAFVPGTPPGRNAGDIGDRTRALRPACRLTTKEIERARRMRRSGETIDVIARSLGHAIDDIELALAAMRTKKPNRSRATINSTIAAREFIANEADGAEPHWATLDRLLGELTMLRVLVGLPPLRKP